MQLQDVRGLLHTGRGVTRLGGKGRRAQGVAGQHTSVSDTADSERPRDLKSWAAPGAGWISWVLYPLEGFIFLQNHLGKMYRDRGPEGQKETWQVSSEGADQCQRSPRQSCAHLPRGEAAGRAKAWLWRTLGPEPFRCGDRSWDSLLLLRGPDPSPGRLALLRPWHLPARGRGCWGCARLQSGW